MFILVMDVLNSFFRLAESRSLFTPLHAPSIKYRVSLYTDDIVAFIAPATRDIVLLKGILQSFARASGLHTNMAKCQAMSIRCTKEEFELIQQLFSCQLVNFPCRHLSILLSVFKLKRDELQPLVDACSNRFPSWKSRFMSRDGRTTLTKITLSPIPIHVSIAVDVDPWVLRAMDKIRSAFMGGYKALGDQYMVAWAKVVKPVELGGLGVLDLVTLGYALCLRWEWLARTDPNQS
jgi:hypothetical protein